MIIYLKKDDLTFDLKVLAIHAIRRATCEHGKKSVLGTNWRECRHVTAQRETITTIYAPGDFVSIYFEGEFQFSISLRKKISCKFSFASETEWGIGVIEDLSQHPRIRERLKPLQERIYRGVVWK